LFVAFGTSGRRQSNRHSNRNPRGGARLACGGRKLCVRDEVRAEFAHSSGGLESRAGSWHIDGAPTRTRSNVEIKTSVLVVDDNQDLAENIAEILDLRGFVTMIATSGEEALPRALRDSASMLVTDFRLPGMSGAELVRQVRERRRDLRAVVMSAYTDDDTVAAALDAGADFLPKPVDFSALSRFLTAP
jgi:CheY-like chemotaxis protein